MAEPEPIVDEEEKNSEVEQVPAEIPIQPVEEVEETPEPEAEVTEHKLECKCGNIFLDDSNFCRMCGIPRAQAEAL